VKIKSLSDLSATQVVNVNLASKVDSVNPASWPCMPRIMLRI